MKVGIIGLGYVGLPLAVAFAEAGHEVFGVDTDARAVEALNEGRTHVEDIADDRLMAIAPRFTARTRHNELGGCDAVIICVPTPLANQREPDPSYVIDPGRTDYTIRTTPKVVGGLTEASLERAIELYSEICDTVVPVSTPEAAELSKLLENIFRSVNIALVNELAILCDRMGVDVWEV